MMIRANSLLNHVNTLQCILLQAMTEIGRIVGKLMSFTTVHLQIKWSFPSVQNGFCLGRKASILQLINAQVLWFATMPYLFHSLPESTAADWAAVKKLSLVNFSVMFWVTDHVDKRTTTDKANKCSVSYQEKKIPTMKIRWENLSKHKHLPSYMHCSAEWVIWH